VGEPAIRERALRLAGKIQLEDGVGSAVAFIGRYLS
jgi:hypothetical protein